MDHLNSFKISLIFLLVILVKFRLLIKTKLECHKGMVILDRGNTEVVTIKDWRRIRDRTNTIGCNQTRIWINKMQISSWTLMDSRNNIHLITQLNVQCILRHNLQITSKCTDSIIKVDLLHLVKICNKWCLTLVTHTRTQEDQSNQTTIVTFQGWLLP